MSLFSITRPGLSAISVLVVVLWGLIAAEARIQHRIEREYQRIHEVQPASAPAVPASQRAVDRYLA